MIKNSMAMPHMQARTKPTSSRNSPVKITAVVFAVSLLGACATPALPPPPPPPPPAAVERIPYRPLPPGGASYAMQMPGKN
ncbi:MAG: hypothetical protein AAFO78_14650, partial [Pseudomonadota bacterium]